MTRISLLIAAAAVVGFAGAASAGIDPPPLEEQTYGECVSAFNEAAGAPGQNKDAEGNASDIAKERNDARKAACEEFKGNNNETEGEPS